MEQILNANDTGQKMYEDHVTERINGNISLCAKVTKVGNMMFMSGNKATTIKLRDKTVDLKETKDLYGRLMILAKSTRDIDQKGAIGNHEFTLTPRSLFSPDGSMLRCTDKSKLIRLLELLGNEAELEQGRLPSQEAGCVYEGPLSEDAVHVLPTESRYVGRGIAAVDGMVILHKMQSTAIGTVVDLSHCFNDLLLSMTREYDEIILVFDTYKDVFLKFATREARLQGQIPVQYHIHDETRIKHITMKRFLSHDKTKADLADYLAMRVLSYNTDSPKLVITSSSGYTRSNGSIEFEDNNHEEADTLMIHHSMLSSRRNPANARIVIFSPDTDVLVLAVANHHLLLRNTSVSMVSGVIDVEPIARALGRQRANTLPALHAFSGADTVGKFNQLGKTTWMNIFMKSGSDTMGALEQLLTVNESSEQQLTMLASFVCDAYCLKGIDISGIPQLRWYLFCKHYGRE